jgi:hypothetical protein
MGIVQKRKNTEVEQRRHRARLNLKEKGKE